MSDDSRQPDTYLVHLAESGVLAEAEAIFDQLDAGSNPCVGTDLEEIREHVEGMLKTQTEPDEVA